MSAYTTSEPTADEAAEATTPTAASEVARLLADVDIAARSTGQASPERLAADAAKQQPLIEGRLGMASALFAALRLKHAATADHCLRVALGCSRWAAALGMPDKLRTQLEAAALLHDIGKIGVPDGILLKPGRLSEEELAVIDSSREASRQILRSAGAPDEVVDGVAAASAWYDGTHRSVPLCGDQTPFLSRMIAIVDAFDAMTTDQVYRRARSRERAVADLYAAAGTQFDPELINSFGELFQQDQSKLEDDVARRWLTTMANGGPAAWANSPAGPAPAAARDPLAPFPNRLVEHTHDAVVYLDRRCVVSGWNTGAERITGVGASAAVGKVLTPSLLDMATAAGDLIEDSDSPFERALQDGMQVVDRVSILGRSGQRLAVDMHVIPVNPDDSPGAPVGLVVLLRDVSSEATLEERCQTLKAQITKDPMTQVANRAEFDRMLGAFVEAHFQTGMRCSLIMADIDHFKSVNDNYGHQAGDEAIRAFAAVMKSLCRSGDLVARYGGEEFAVLCADCSNATAAGRAEVIRRKLAETTLEFLGGKNITASFGVTELQPGDTPHTLLRRADRALLQAKDQGRNQVVQLGDGMQPTDTPKAVLGGLGRWVLGPIAGGGKLIETRLVTNVPVALAVDKLRGFIADRDAKILKTDENFLRLTTTECETTAGRKAGEDPIEFVVEIKLSEERVERRNAAGLAAGQYAHTFVDVEIQPRRDRDRRKSKAIDRARQLLCSLQSYLMARQVVDEPQG
ncbi:diguanylate cyclase [Botrimarina sp.]|uniref:bifunctional diguanylate cyclase/phosphohydrolase n=1 Tax=Botrimarina sp. TaxID=2795802 RepID=UPI0032EE0862